MVTAYEYKAAYSNLKVILLKKSVTQKELAQGIGMDRATFNLKINRTNGRDFTLGEAIKISEYLDEKIDNFF